MKVYDYVVDGQVVERVAYPEAPPSLTYGKGVLVEVDPAIIQAQWDRTDALDALAEIDLKSIRAIREWIASQPTAPQRLKDFETQAATHRTKL